MNQKTSTLTIRIDAQLKEQARQKAERKGINLTQAITQLLSDYVADDEESSKQNSTANTESDNREVTARLDAIEKALWGKDKTTPGGSRFLSHWDGISADETDKGILEVLAYKISNCLKDLEGDRQDLDHLLNEVDHVGKHEERLETLEEQVENHERKLNANSYNRTEMGILNKKIYELRNQLNQLNQDLNRRFEQLETDNPFLVTPNNSQSNQSKRKEGVTFPQLAEAYGLTRNTLENYHKGRSTPRGKTKNGRNKADVWKEIQRDWFLGNDYKWYKRNG